MDESDYQAMFSPRDIYDLTIEKDAKKTILQPPKGVLNLIFGQ